MHVPSSLFDLEAIDTIGSEPKLPSYSRRPSAGCSTVLMNRRTKKFTYKLDKSIARPGISLTVSGDSRLSKELPSFMEGDKVSGEIQISVNNGQGIRSIDVSLQGRVLTGRSSDGVFTFLKLQDTLWTADTNDLEAHRDSANEYDYVWPFSLVLPKEVVLPSTDGKHDRVFPLPHTFMESGVPAQVYYELVVCLKQGKWKKNQRISTQIGYFQSNQLSPRVRDLFPATDSCVEAGEARWKKLKTINVTGTVSQSQQRAVELSCTLSLKDSLWYTRGSSIPLQFEIRSQDQQAVELLSSSDAVVVHLNRRIRYKDVQMCGGKSSRWSSIIESVGVATWSIHEDSLSKKVPSSDSSYRSTLVGKLKLNRKLVPSAVIANLAIDYYISVYPFSSPSFHSKGNKSVPLISRSVQINTDLSVYPDVNDLESSNVEVRTVESV